MTAPTLPRRRWLRYSLRSLLVFIVLIGALMGWIAKERRQSLREMAIAEQLEVKGWNVTIGGPFDSWELGPQRDQGWWRNMEQRILGGRIFELLGAGKSIDSVHPTSTLANLRYISLSNTAVRDLTPLTKVRSLRFIGIGRSPISLDQIETFRKALPKCGMEYTALE